MKKIAGFLLTSLILLGCVGAIAVGGTSTDPLISLGYLTNTYMPDVMTQVQSRISTYTGAPYRALTGELEAKAGHYFAQAAALSGGEGYAQSYEEQRFKKGDVVVLETGASVLLLAGSATLNHEGSVVDVTTGTAAVAGSALLPRHRYLVAENTRCRIVVTSDTAVLAPQGLYTVTASQETDYNMLADALKAMGMFRGSDTGYGDGYDLEVAPTRIQGLIMFLRMLGEEDEALACQQSSPFTDVPAWCKSYVDYAWHKGYTKGIDGTAMLFGTQNPIKAAEYETFLLRALGYRDSGENPDFAWDTSLLKALETGCLTAREYKMLTEGPFLRAQVAYTSYYSLSAKMKGSETTLLSRLTSAGALDAETVKKAMDGVTVERLS